MENKNCSHCNIEKTIEDFYNKYTECKICKSNRSSKRYYENKHILSIQRKIYYGEKREKLLQKEKNRYINYKELFSSSVELEKKLKVMEEKFKVIDSGKHPKIHKRNL